MPLILSAEHCVCLFVADTLNASVLSTEHSIILTKCFHNFTSESLVDDRDLVQLISISLFPFHVGPPVRDLIFFSI